MWYVSGWIITILMNHTLQKLQMAKKYINGGYQTDLRSFINNVINSNTSY